MWAPTCHLLDGEDRDNFKKKERKTPPCNFGWAPENIFPDELGHSKKKIALKMFFFFYILDFYIYLDIYQFDPHKYLFSYII